MCRDLTPEDWRAIADARAARVLARVAAGEAESERCRILAGLGLGPGFKWRNNNMPKKKATTKKPSVTNTSAPVSANLIFGLDRARNGITALPAGAQNVVLVDLDYLLQERNHVLAAAQDAQVQRDRALSEATAKGA